ncbi:MAG: NAD(P)-dependent oxidoreductase [Bacteroidia bacterium]
MEVILFGASGGTGKEVLLQALEQGHCVTAITRDPSKITIQSESLTVVQGDVLSSNLDHFYRGKDAVICCLGAPANKAGTLRSEGTKNIINAMKRANVNRLICQTSLGFSDSSSVLNCTSFFFKRVVVPYILKETFKEHHLQEMAIKQSGLTWTIVRPGNLTNGKKTENYKYGFSFSDPTLKVKISRADVAHLLVKQLATKENNQKVIGISY